MTHSFPTFSGFGNFFTKSSDTKNFVDKYTSAPVTDGDNDIKIIDRSNLIPHNNNQKPVKINKSKSCPLNESDKNKIKNNIIELHESDINDKKEHNFRQSNTYLQYMGDSNNENKENGNDEEDKLPEELKRKIKKSKSTTKISHVYKSGCNVYQEGSYQNKFESGSCQSKFESGAIKNQNFNENSRNTFNKLGVQTQNFQLLPTIDPQKWAALSVEERQSLTEFYHGGIKLYLQN